MVIYKITNQLNGKIYVGQTKYPIEKRFLQHSKADSPLGQAIRQCGIQNFTIEVIERCQSQEQLNEREIFWINALNSTQPYGYNVRDGGGGYERQIKVSRKTDDCSAFHEKLKYLREHQELSQREICKRLNLPTSTYCRYESGETQPNLIILKLIANFFDVTVDYLLDNQVFTDNELVDLKNFLENGNYTVYGKFPSDRERQKLLAMLEILFRD